MTPEELVNKINEELSLKCDLYDGELTKIKLIIQQAKSEWCKEQRELCAAEITKNSYECTIKENRERILNAPEPFK